ncbi:DUF6714 family protein [Piscinibacterium candidicorallinum]|uniref:DUF6714 family protein n=1 Tax=Piscinibacterium candidicorallinum TaxID=1793872 RepID=A0ABV7H3G7_9BURK
MAPTGDKLAFVEKAFASAFAGVVLGGGMSIRQSEAVDRPPEPCDEVWYRALPADEITDDWSRIPSSELERAQVAFFDAEAFRYYIAPLALSVIRNYDSSSMRVIGTMSGLYPKERAWTHHMNQYALLSPAQRHAIALFLHHAPDLVQLEGEEVKLCERALRDYWLQFLR